MAPSPIWKNTADASSTRATRSVHEKSRRVAALAAVPRPRSGRGPRPDPASDVLAAEAGRSRGRPSLPRRFRGPRRPGSGLLRIASQARRAPSRARSEVPAPSAATATSSEPPVAASRTRTAQASAHGCPVPAWAVPATEPRGSASAGRRLDRRPSVRSFVRVLERHFVSRRRARDALHRVREPLEEVPEAKALELERLAHARSA